ncbi:MAG TPA: multicopper oxidase family protein, partial [Marmoricola sp.]|nr:multicopper oxidase family protein [Marmoricola sp.]
MSGEDCADDRLGQGSPLSRRALLRGAAGLTGAAGLGLLAGCNDAGAASAVSPAGRAVRDAEAARRTAGQKVVTARLDPRPVTVDLGGTTVDTWAYG